MKIDGVYEKKSESKMGLKIFEDTCMCKGKMEEGMKKRRKKIKKVWRKKNAGKEQRVNTNVIDVDEMISTVALHAMLV